MFAFKIAFGKSFIFSQEKKIKGKNFNLFTGGLVAWPLHEKRNIILYCTYVVYSKLY